jgi:hypothetical protein
MMEPVERKLFYPCAALGRLLEPFRQLKISRAPPAPIVTAAEQEAAASSIPVIDVKAAPVKDQTSGEVIQPHTEGVVKTETRLEVGRIGNFSLS